MHDEVDYRRHLNDYEGRRGKRKDYPAVSVGAEYEDELAIGHQRDYSQQKDFHPLVFHELNNRLGNLNECSPKCQNKVGHCAENYAASGVLKKVDPKGRIKNVKVLKKLKFTKAFRPRTWQNIDWCANCYTMFD